MSLGLKIEMLTYFCLMIWSGSLFSLSDKRGMFSADIIWEKDSYYQINVVFLRCVYRFSLLEKRILISFKLLPICFCLLA